MRFSKSFKSASASLFLQVCFCKRLLNLVVTYWPVSCFLLDLPPITQCSHNVYKLGLLARTVHRWAAFTFILFDGH